MLPLSSPPLFFRLCVRTLCVLCLLCFLAPDNPLHAASYEERFQQIADRGAALEKDAKRGQRRDLWQALIEDFYALSQKKAAGSVRPKALYRAATSAEELSVRSRIGADREKALSLYTELARRFPGNSLADDGLLRAARIQAERARDIPAALQILERIQRDFSKGDMAQEAAAYEQKLRAAQTDGQKADTATKAETATKTQSPKDSARNSRAPAKLMRLDWKNLNERTVSIELEPDRPVQWTVRHISANPAEKRPARIVLELEHTRPNPKLNPGSRIRNSPLSRMRVEYVSPNTSRILLDFNEISRYKVKEHTKPFRLELIASALDAEVPGGTRVEPTLLADNPELTAKAPRDLARQLGLSVKTVVLDPGHGGKDPGTQHKNVLEKECTLDIARRVGRHLEANGLNVVYTRKNDSAVGLEERPRHANDARGDLFVSIHVNASPEPTVAGVESYSLDMQSSSGVARVVMLENSQSSRRLGDLDLILADLMLTAKSSESRKLASTVQKAIMSRLKKKGYTSVDGGTKSGPFHVLMGATMPSILIEVGYCTNEREARLLRTSAYRSTLAQGIAEGILRYREQLQQGR